MTVAQPLNVDGRYFRVGPGPVADQSEEVGGRSEFRGSPSLFLDKEVLLLLNPALYLRPLVNVYH